MEIIKLRAMAEQLLKEKSQLVDALKNETLANEEQRNYIQILRKAIDQKMESLGLGDLLTFKNIKHDQDPVSIYTILSELKRECDAWKK